MQIDWKNDGGIPCVHLSALEALGGVTAFFTGRSGGVSVRWNGGLNWSYSVGDDPEAVRENRRRTLALLGGDLHHAVMGGLVHGDRVVAIPSAEAADVRAQAVLPDTVRLIPDCDGLITDQPGVALVTTAADCVPVFLYDPVRRAIAAVHAGWRGTVKGIGARAVAAMVERYGCRPADLVGAVGPSIGPCCYEVDDQVAEPVRAYYGEAAQGLLSPTGAPGKYHLNLWEANRYDLLRAGVGSVTISGECTSCGVHRLFSHRAEHGAAGRGAGVIMLR